MEIMLFSRGDYVLFTRRVTESHGESGESQRVWKPWRVPESPEAPESPEYPDAPEPPSEGKVTNCKFGA